VLDGGTVYYRNTGFRPFERQRAEPGPFPSTHYAHLHNTKLALDRFNYNARFLIPIYLMEINIFTNPYDQDFSFFDLLRMKVTALKKRLTDYSHCNDDNGIP
jgi:hypothetical protein